MTRFRVFAIVALIIGGLLAYFVWSTQSDPTSNYRFKLGLDLAGGTELVYKADMSQTPSGEQSAALGALQGVIERRIFRPPSRADSYQKHLYSLVQEQLPDSPRPKYCLISTVTAQNFLKKSRARTSADNSRYFSTASRSRNLLFRRRFPAAWRLSPAASQRPKRVTWYAI